MKRTLFTLSLLCACCGGGGNSSSSLAGTWIGNVYLVENTCEQEAGGTISEILLVNLDGSRVLVEENSIEHLEGTLTENSFCAASQEEDQCYHEDGSLGELTYIRVETLELTASGDSAHLIRTVTVNGCTNTHCAMRWEGELRRSTDAP